MRNANLIGVGKQIEKGVDLLVAYWGFQLLG